MLIERSMPEQPESIWTMQLHDTLSFETPLGIVDVLRVAPGWIYTWRGTNIAVLVPYSRFVGRAEGAERFVR
jgi:hypothetical protein